MKLTPDQIAQIESLLRQQPAIWRPSIAKHLGLTKSYVDEYLKSR